MMNEKKPTWQCPVCDSPALYENLMVDGYFLEVIKSKELPGEENEIILNQDGSWHPVPRDDSDESKKKVKKTLISSLSLKMVLAVHLNPHQQVLRLKKLSVLTSTDKCVESLPLVILTADY